MPEIDKSKIKVLFVDDEQKILTTYKMYIEGFNSFYATSGREALDMVKQQAFDVIVTDYNMPEMNGYDFAIEAKKIIPSARIILMSAQIDKELSMKFSNKIHVWNMFDKPVDIESLEASIIQGYCDLENERDQKRMATVGAASGKMLHDLGNSFFIMSLSTELGIQSSQDAATIEKFEKIKKACKTMQETSEKYKKSMFSMKNDGLIDTVNVKQYFEQIGSELKDMFEGHKMIYSQLLEVDENLTFNIDPHMMRQVLYNLAKNSLDAVKGDKDAFLKLQVIQATDTKTIEIRIIDSGNGILNTVVDKMFQDGFSTKGDKGTGMGLGYAKNLIEAYLGKLWYAPVSGNTCFRIELSTYVQLMNITLPSEIPKTEELEDPSLVNVVNPKVNKNDPNTKVAS